MRTLWIIKIFALRINKIRGNFWILRIGLTGRCQKLGIISKSSDVIKKCQWQKMCSCIDILQWKKNIDKDSNNFWHWKLTLKVKFWHFLTLFDTSPLTQFLKFCNFLQVCWFLGKIFLILYPPFKNSTTRIVIVHIHSYVIK
mgnify:CR=1 FL=1